MPPAAAIPPPLSPARPPGSRLTCALGTHCVPLPASPLPADKTLKKVQEGLEVFDEHQEQYDTTEAGNANAREKLESQVGVECATCVFSCTRLAAAAEHMP